MLKTFSMLCILSFCFVVGICFFHNDVTTHADMGLDVGLDRARSDSASASGYCASASGYCGHCRKYWDDQHYDISYYQKWECPKWFCGEEGYDEVSRTPNNNMSCHVTNRFTGVPTARVLPHHH